MVTDMREESGEQEITIINDENALQRVSPNLPNLKLDAECMIPFNNTHTVIKAWRDNRVYFFNSENRHGYLQHGPNERKNVYKFGQ